MAVTLTCARCDGNFSVPPSRLKFGNPRFCSSACWYAVNVGQANAKHKPRIEKTCGCCGVVFTTYPSRAATSFCSKACKVSAQTGRSNSLRQPRIDCKCQRCGKSFQSPAWEIRKGNGKYCGRECANAAMRVATEYRYGPDWAMQRRRALERDDRSCRDCGAHGAGVRIEVHHVKPRRLGGGNALANLLTLCRPCHKRAEAALIREEINNPQPQQLALLPRNWARRARRTAREQAKGMVEA